MKQKTVKEKIDEAIALRKLSESNIAIEMPYDEPRKLIEPMKCCYRFYVDKNNNILEKPF